MPDGAVSTGGAEDMAVQVQRSDPSKVARHRSELRVTLDIPEFDVFSAHPNTKERAIGRKTH